MDTSAFELVMTVLAAMGGAGAVVVSLAAFLAKLWSDRLAQLQRLSGEIDLDLRKRRIDAYATLWKATSALPKWPRDESLRYEDLRALSEGLRAWYYETGGMFLSRKTHAEGYGPLQGAIAQILREGRSGPLTPGDYETVREKCSALRTLLADDIESRRASPL